MMSKLKFAIVGCGNIGKRHAALIAGKHELVASCDVHLSRSREIADKFGGFSYASSDELFSNHRNLDVAVICSPNGFHAEHAIQAMQNGAHVLCEKPMAIHLYDCEKMIETSNRFQKRLLVVKQNRYNPPVIAVKKLLDDKSLGNITCFQVNGFWNRPSSYYVNSWHGSKDLDGGTLFTQFSHFIDLLYWFLGDVEKVESITGNFLHEGLMDFEDSGCVLMTMKNGAIGSFNYTVNAFEKNMEGSIALFGEKGTVKIGGEYLNKIEYWNVKDVQEPSVGVGNPANNYGEHKGSMNNHSQVYDHLEAVLKRGEAPQPNAFDAMKTVEIISKIYSGIHHKI